jgi:hypothetical protein
MNVYRVRREGGVTGYDQFDAFVCVAESESAAREMMPDSEHDIPAYKRGEQARSKKGNATWSQDHDWDWPPGEALVVDLIATGAEGPARVVLASFNAG